MTETNDRDAADLLHLMGHLYLKSGQTQRGLVLLLIATRMAPEHTGILRALCRGFLTHGNGGRALKVIERLEAAGQGDATLLLLRGRAEWLNGDRDAARRHFRGYLERRQQANAPQERA
ncbi:tetratricopeptide repeat protein [Salinicola acroporae]|uniref:Type III secretion protein n=1 Tax=Salinicola acroporae TaxID=1541440 RepID=A0ABT6I290_9GAMM|nr:type III secretion protein [Salinicola acroporae]MDH4571788.1 type III secretion protein [Salinicola acroporae]